MTGRLQNKVVLITGTGQGQGRSAALLFAKEGAKIVGCDLKEEESKETARMVKEAGGEMVSLEPLDLINEKQVQELVELTEKTYGRLDVLYNNASAARFGQITDMSWEDWEFTIRNELHILFFITKIAVPLMIKSGGGAIINTASIAGMTGSFDFVGNAAHAATKGGVISFTRQLAIELASKKIRANVIAPGVIVTPPVEPLVNDPNVSKIFMQKIPMGKFGQPEDIAKMALFLASDDSSYSTGALFVADGGWTAW